MPPRWSKSFEIKDSGCGSVGRAVASDDRGRRFESSHWQNFKSGIYLFTVNCIEKTKINKKRLVMGRNKSFEITIDNIVWPLLQPDGEHGLHPPLRPRSHPNRSVGRHEPQNPPEDPGLVKVHILKSAAGWVQNLVALWDLTFYSS